jgi:hypothetical protein
VPQPTPRIIPTKQKYRHPRCSMRLSRFAGLWIPARSAAASPFPPMSGGLGRHGMSSSSTWRTECSARR